MYDDPNEIILSVFSKFEEERRLIRSWKSIWMLTKVFRVSSAMSSIWNCDLNEITKGG